MGWWLILSHNNHKETKKGEELIDAFIIMNSDLFIRKVLSLILVNRNSMTTNLHKKRMVSSIGSSLRKGIIHQPTNKIFKGTIPSKI